MPDLSDPTESLRLKPSRGATPTLSACATASNPVSTHLILLHSITQERMSQQRTLRAGTARELIHHAQRERSARNRPVSTSVGRQEECPPQVPFTGHWPRRCRNGDLRPCLSAVRGPQVVSGQDRTEVRINANERRVAPAPPFHRCGAGSQKAAGLLLRNIRSPACSNQRRARTPSSRLHVAGMPKFVPNSASLRSPAALTFRPPSGCTIARCTSARAAPQWCTS